MRVEKQGSRSIRGCYIGGFVQLFDWNATSHKKLSRTLDLSEELELNGSSNTKKPLTQLHPAIEDYTSSCSRLQGCASSLIDDDDDDDDDYGKAPGVVARLMGLNSLPNSNYSETHSNRYINSRSMHDSSALYVKKSLELDQKDYRQMERKHSVIEKFQTESLPPKSARSVPITQHKLLSPIKNSAFMSSDDPARIMEAASKIPLVPSSSSSSSSSSSVPFSARKPSKISESHGRSKNSDQGNAHLGPHRRLVESNAARNLKGQSMNKSWDGCLNQKPFLEDGKKSVSLALQAKVNVKKREGSILSGGRSLYGAESVNNKPNIQKNTLKTPTNSVLKKNNHKQNSLLERGKSAAKSLESPIKSQYRKPVPEKSLSKNSFNPTNKTVNGKKRSSEDVKKNKVHDKNHKSGNVVKSNGLDVVSFTFTSPLSRSAEKKHAFLADDHGKNALIDFYGNINGLNSATGGDSLSSPSVSRESSTNYRARISRTPIFQDKKNPDSISKDDLLCRFSSNYHQVAKETPEYRELLSDRDPSGISLTQPCFLVESCISPYTANAYCTDVFSKKSTMMEIDTELSNLERCANSESGYVKDILSDIESMFENFTLGRTRKIVNPPLFYQLEAQRPVFEKQYEPKLRRKLLFDCVSECVDLRCRVWRRGLAAMRRKDQLSKEVCKKISGWEQMKDCMVDELVDKDMSGDQHQKWLDFDVEAFELGIEIERRLFSSLINEALDDIVVL